MSSGRQADPCEQTHGQDKTGTFGDFAYLLIQNFHNASVGNANL